MALGALVVVSTALILYMNRGTTFWVDELFFFQNSKGLDPNTLLAPHNGQLVLVARLIYAGLFEAFGPDYTVFRIVAALGVAGVGVLVYLLARPRVGPVVALAPVAVLLVFGSAWGETVSPNGILNVYCLAAVLGALLALDRGGRFADALACALLTISIASWSFGVAACAGIGIWLLATGGWRRVWIAALPLALYCAWYAARTSFVPPAPTTALHADLANLLLAPNFAVQSAGAAAAGLLGLDYGFGQPGGGPPGLDFAWAPAAATGAVIALAIARRRNGAGRIAWPLIAIVACFYVLIAAGITYGRLPGAGQYTYPVAALGVLIAVEILAGIRLGAAAMWGLLAVSLFAVAANVMLLESAGDYLRGYSGAVRAELGAIELARPAPPPMLMLSTGVLGSPLVAGTVSPGPYLDAVDRIGSFADTPAAIAAETEEVREGADAVLAQAAGVHAAATPRPGPSLTCHVTRRGGFALSPGTTLLSAPSAGGLRLRRFGSAYTVDAGTVPANGFVAVRTSRDAFPPPWRGQVVPSEPITICR